MTESLTTRIRSVTVYPDRARITRAGTCELATTTRQVELTDLPSNLEPDSVRVRGAGQARVRILGVDLRRAHLTQAPAPAVRTLEAEIAKAEDALQGITDRAQVLSNESTYLDGIRGATGEVARAVAWGRMSVAQHQALARSLAEDDGAVRDRLRALTAERREVEANLAKLRAELKQHQAARTRARHVAVVDIEVLQAGGFGLDLDYVIGNAGWQPLYDARLRPADGTRPPRLELALLAQVSQTSGEDWLGVELRVSTARPSLHQRVPELTPWNLGPARPPRHPTRAPTEAMGGGPPVAAMAALEVADAEPFEAGIQTAQVSTSDLAITFTVPGTSDIPGDGTSRKLTLSQLELEPRLDHLAVPKHTDAVFRRVVTRNDGPSPLLAGPANLFVGDEYIGTNRLEQTPCGAELELLFGVEDGVVVERELTRRDVDKKLLSDRRLNHRTYRIRLHNHTPGPVEVEVQDHLPIARHEDIKVKVVRLEPEPDERTELNLLTWKLRLEPDQERTVGIEFTVEHPRAMTVEGLGDS